MPSEKPAEVSALLSVFSFALSTGYWTQRLPQCACILSVYWYEARVCTVR